ncbi:MAG: diguanylate cyclase [Candidatus Omnitrophota bacterium]|nr:MAG: diguanylate cyclase [Candidatus Omnitrophota bacterium]
MKVLIADDSLVALRKLEATLIKWGYEVISAGNGYEAWDILQQADSPKLAILDWMMPGMDGIDICRKIRANRREPYVYILMLTARAEKQDIINGLEAGADDYLPKPFDSHELEVRLRAGKRIVELQEELVQARETMREMAIKDPLTTILNRRAILDLLDKEYMRSRRLNSPLAVIMADIDHFKHVNDRYGHLAGDQVLREITARLTRSIRSYDSIGRYGGEEFMVILPGCTLANAINQANRFQHVIEAESVEYEGASIFVTASFGVTTFDGMMDIDTTQLIRHADEALYQAKKKGRNRVEVV